MFVIRIKKFKTFDNDFEAGKSAIYSAEGKGKNLFIKPTKEILNLMKKSRLTPRP